MLGLGQFLHGKIPDYFDLVSVSSTKQGKVVDVDTLLPKEKANIYVLHDEFMVYVVTSSSDVCRHIYSVAAKKTNVSVQLDQ
jgi:hypothetical protein